MWTNRHHGSQAPLFSVSPCLQFLAVSVSKVVCLLLRPLIRNNLCSILATTPDTCLFSSNYLKTEKKTWRRRDETIWLSDVQQHTASGSCAWSISRLGSGAAGSPVRCRAKAFRTEGLSVH